MANLIFGRSEHEFLSPTCSKHVVRPEAWQKSRIAKNAREVAANTSKPLGCFGANFDTVHCKQSIAAHAKTFQIFFGKFVIFGIETA